MAKMARRGFLRREIKRAVGNCDLYLNHMKLCVEKIDGDNADLQESFESLAYFAAVLQEKTQALYDNI
jgi:hypothetical protein